MFSIWNATLGWNGLKLGYHFLALEIFISKNPAIWILLKTGRHHTRAAEVQFNINKYIRKTLEIYEVLIQKILRISPYSVEMRENTIQKKLRIWTLFTQWYQLWWIILQKLPVTNLNFTTPTHSWWFSNEKKMRTDIMQKTCKVASHLWKNLNTRLLNLLLL